MMNESQVSFESWCNFQYLLESTAVSRSWYKRNFLFELLLSKDNLVDQINKNNFNSSFQPVSNLHELLS